MRKLTSRETIAAAVAQLRSHGSGVDVGFPQLTDKVYFAPGTLTILAARSSMGKSAMMMSMALNASKSVPVAIFSLEMTLASLTARALSCLTDVPLTRIINGNLSEHEKNILKQGVADLEKRNIYIDTETGISVDYIANKVGEIDDCPPQIVFIDFLQLMRGDDRSSRYRELDDITSGLANISKLLKVPIVCLCQLNRQVEHRDNHFPRVSDIRESGGVEQAADIVLLLHRPAYYALYEENRVAPDDGEAFIVIGKNRNGPTGQVRICWVPETASFLPVPSSFVAFDSEE